MSVKAAAVAVILLCVGGALMAEHDGRYAFLLDDFAEKGRSRIGTRWEGITDRVMGGVSQMTVDIVPEEDGGVLHMRGTVSLENNGGFIQARLPLASSGSFDAGAYTGVALEAKATGTHYYLHIRTPRTVFPWSHFAAAVPVGEDWQYVRLPFAEFEPQYMLGGRLEPARLRSIAIVAARAAFDADIQVRAIGFYR